MDLSVYYEEFQSTCNFAVFAFLFIVFCIVLACILTMKRKNYSLKLRIAACLVLVIPYAAIVSDLSYDTYLAKKDIEEKTICYYEGNIEITEISVGIHYRAVFVIDGEEFCLRYSDKDDYFEQIEVGKYDGKIVYAQHLAQVLHLELQESQLD